MENVISATLQRCRRITFALKKLMWKKNENGQRRPDIFEIATAYENGNGGIIWPKKKDGIYGTYQTLSDDEKKFILNNPRTAIL